MKCVQCVLGTFKTDVCTLVWAALWNFQGQAWAGWELSILSWLVLLRPLRLLQRLGELLSILLHKHMLCTKTDRGSSSLCSSFRGLNSTIQLRIDSYQPAHACPWKFHNPVYAKLCSIWAILLDWKISDVFTLVISLHVTEDQNQTWNQPESKNCPLVYLLCAR